MKLYKCKYCGKEFNNAQKLGGHISSHKRGSNYSLKRVKSKAYKERLRKSKETIKRCKYCGKEFNHGRKLGGHVVRCKSNPKSEETISKTSKNSIGKKLSEEHKLNVSNGMKKAHKEKRAWNIGKSRWNNKKSYPEEFFEKVINNEFKNKKYTCEHPISIYSLDFAWINLKKAIEIDASQHERFKEYSERDKRKDKLANEMGWEILRIKWKDMCNDPKHWIQIAYNFIH